MPKPLNGRHQCVRQAALLGRLARENLADSWIQSAEISSAAACGGDSDRSAGRYCTEVGNHLTQLNQPSLRNGDDITAMLATWRTVADAAPIAIQREWDTVIGAMATAASADPSNPASLQKVADGAGDDMGVVFEILLLVFELRHARLLAQHTCQVCHDGGFFCDNQGLGHGGGGI